MAFFAEYSSQELLQAQLQLWHQSLGFFKSVALSIALDLRIADAIHSLGGAATVPQILAEAGINPCKLRDLRRVMRVLTVSGIFSVQQPSTATASSDCKHGAEIYKLTAASRLLVRDTISTMGQQPPFLSVQLMLETCRGCPASRGIHAWFHQDQQQPGLTPFALANNGQTIWERAEHDDAACPFNDAMASDTAFLMPIVLKECGEVFHGLTSLVDVAGGFGGAAATIAAAFPDLKCTVLDLPQVVAKAPSGTNVQYVAGDMFENIPPANAVFLKWIMHDWGDDECVKILKNCKQAIPPRDAGGKIIIIDMVVGSGPSDIKLVETQVLYDLLIMNFNGVERDEQDWKKIFFEAGFKDYKIIPILGVRSIIELYP
ncbi:5-pentadecatrienyl resorcinol O-methyltransferase [Dichanthelium oligosanthes]|uniref:5-pentadecatrienyl resorcinol O-methyltransferase n=1 Tax=Dichanthelium oligosanthes TaxID=888268 RepID=A0A1E5WF66_9POAL|nr:5-pentadecatrienyl resorcinol O-methyltransferase [Dichanthelium oligosanthes]